MFSRLILKISLAVIALALLLTGLGFFLSSLYFYLNTLFNNPAIAAFLTGLTLLLVAVIILLIVMMIKIFKPVKKKPVVVKKPLVDECLDNLSDPLGLVEKYPVKSSLVAVGAGFLLGFSAEARKLLTDGVVAYLNGESLAEILKDKIQDNKPD